MHSFKKIIKLFFSSIHLSSLINISIAYARTAIGQYAYTNGWNVTCLWFKRLLKMF